MVLQAVLAACIQGFEFAACPFRSIRVLSWDACVVLQLLAGVAAVVGVRIAKSCVCWCMWWLSTRFWLLLTVRMWELGAAQQHPSNTVLLGCYY